MKRSEGHARSNRIDGWDWAGLGGVRTEDGGGGGRRRGGGLGGRIRRLIPDVVVDKTRAR